MESFVRLVDEKEAVEKEMTTVEDGKFRINHNSKTLTDPEKPMRNTVGLKSKLGMKDGLWVTCVDHMPSACGAWPILMSTTGDGSVFPEGGEIKIAEGANLQNSSISGMFTIDQCHMREDAYSNITPNPPFSGIWRSGPSGTAERNCYAFANNWGTGCSLDAQEKNFGQSVNEKGGGCFVLELKSDEFVRIFSFTKDELPNDFESNPDPST
eukprot:Selendium_serpulae@DN6184_c0_g1_i10.p1